MHYEKIPFKFMNKKNRTLCKIRKECGKRRFPAALALLSGLRGGDGYAIGRDDLGLVGEDFAARGVDQDLEPVYGVGAVGLVVAEGFDAGEIFQAVVLRVLQEPVHAGILAGAVAAR